MASNLAQAADFNPRFETVVQGGCEEDGGPGASGEPPVFWQPSDYEAALILTTA